MKKKICSLALAICMLFTGSIGASAAVYKIPVASSSGSAGSTGFQATPMSGVPVSSAAPFTVYLSPSSQFANLYVNGGTEEQYMRLVAEAMIPYLNAYGIHYVMAKEKRAMPESTWSNLLQLGAQEAAANNCDLYLSLHSNASSGGARQGTYIYYYTKKPMSRYWAEITQKNYVYPNSDKIYLATNDKLIDMYTPTMPSILVETAFHDNVSDATWIKNNINLIAASLAYSVAQYRHDFYGVEIPAISLS